MNLSIMYLEIAVVALALGILLVDLWMPAQHKSKLGYVAAFGLLMILGISFSDRIGGDTVMAGMYIKDSLAIAFKRFFLITAILVLMMAAGFADRIRTGISEFYTIILFALAGMMFAASANDLVLVFVSLELITVSFYVLTGFQKERMGSLEAGVKYLILGALSSAFMVFGIALIFGTTNTTSFIGLHDVVPNLGNNLVFELGVLLVLIGLAFKLAAFPMQVWAPDVYQGAPTPVTAFLAIGSKAAGIVLLMRFLFGTGITTTGSIHWDTLLMVIAGITIFYGNLCAIPQRNLKRLLGYSSIANAGYLLLGFSALSANGRAAVLYYLAGYLVTLAAAFTVINIVCKDTEDISAVAGLGKRSPFLAVCLTLSMVSLGGIPPLAGFFGKFLLLASIIERGAVNPGYYYLAGVTLIGVVISLYYYFNVIRAVYWSKESADSSPVAVSDQAMACLILCVGGMLFLGLFPNLALNLAMETVRVF